MGKFVTLPNSENVNTDLPIIRNYRIYKIIFIFQELQQISFSCFEQFF